MSALIYELYIIGYTSDVLCACRCCRCFHLCLIWSSGVLTRTPSHIWGRLYLPVFLFRVGLLTLIYSNSMILVSPKDKEPHTMQKWYNILVQMQWG